MIAVDTNILIYSHREDSPWYEAASQHVSVLAENATPWAIPWPCIHEFLAVVTNPRTYARPSTLKEATDQVGAWLESPSLALLTESEGYWELLRGTLQEGRIAGPRVHDARIASLCRLHGVRELWTADRDFSRFPWLTVRNPLVS